MDKIAQATSEERADLFQRAAVALQPQRSPVIIEKDFWVCWALRRVYEVMRFRPQLIFKGGTSLAKAYNTIDRFSEDVDLSLSRSDLGFSDERDPEQPGISGKESKKRLKELVQGCQQIIRDKFLPGLRADFASVIDVSGWNADMDPSDPQTVIFSYPKSNLEEGMKPYIHPAIRLEMGARSDDWPASDREIRPYIAEVFPQAFMTAPSCRVHTLDAVRTYWEKATLLHAEYHRPANKPSKERLSRHYYDLYCLAQHDIGQQALSRLDLLERVIKHKKLFFTSVWAHYETAIPGSFHLVPPQDRIPNLRSDYSLTQAMIFGEAPTWDEITKGLKELECRINGL